MALLFLKRLALLTLPPVITTVLLGCVLFFGAFLSAHPHEQGLLSGWTTKWALVASVMMIAIEVIVGGFGISYLVLIPANLLDFGVTAALRMSGTASRRAGCGWLD